jgi:hypothetical protein
MRTAIFAGLTACALMFAGSANAADTQSASLKLKTAATTEQFIHEGSVWRCKDDACSSLTVPSLPIARACRRLAGQVGELTAFSYRGKSLDEAGLADCNTAAKKS